VPDRANLQGDQVVKLVTPVGGGGQAEPAPTRDLLDACSNAAAGTWCLLTPGLAPVRHRRQRGRVQHQLRPSLGQRLRAPTPGAGQLLPLLDAGPRSAASACESSATCTTAAASAAAPSTDRSGPRRSARSPGPSAPTRDAAGQPAGYVTATRAASWAGVSLLRARRRSFRWQVPDGHRCDAIADFHIRLIGSTARAGGLVTD